MAESEPRAFVVGHPVAHSRSPLIHGHWLRAYDLKGSYERIDVAPDNFPEFLAKIGDRGFVGGNVTIPHKEAAYAAISRRDAAAEAIGAVNTIWIENGELHGGNTDAYGFAANLDERAPGWKKGRKACVLGAGGAARAVVHALVEAGFERIGLVNRNVERAHALAEAFGPSVQAADWLDIKGSLDAADLLVNTTSLGMGGTAFPALPLKLLSEEAIVTDIVYTPLRTPLLARAEKAGFVTVDGLGMLLHQAVPGFERWFGRRPVVTPDLRADVLADRETAL